MCGAARRTFQQINNTMSKYPANPELIATLNTVDSDGEQSYHGDRICGISVKEGSDGAAAIVTLDVREFPRRKTRKLTGTCRDCGCKVECDVTEARYVEDRPGDGANCVKCPDCKNEFLWVR